jgi:succinate-semialdehyde dehydrogenase/glutarate-semialdehyde dehydrogenase
MSYDADLKLFIDGSWRAGEGRDTHSVINPVDGSGIADLPLATAADLEEALAAADRAWPLWRNTDAEKRASILVKAGDLLRERADHIAAILTQEQGKPLAESKAEVIGSASMFTWYAEEIKRDYGRTLVRPTGQRSIVIRQPVGPTATFTPWNFPIYLLAKKVAAALAAGCTVISRPPQETPGCTGELFRALADAGIPNGVATGQRNANRIADHPEGQLHRIGPRRQAADAPGGRLDDPHYAGIGRPCAGPDLRRLRP